MAENDLDNCKTSLVKVKLGENWGFRGTASQGQWGGDLGVGGYFEERWDSRGSGEGLVTGCDVFGEVTPGYGFPGTRTVLGWGREQHI